MGEQGVQPYCLPRVARNGLHDTDAVDQQIRLRFVNRAADRRFISHVREAHPLGILSQYGMSATSERVCVEALILPGTTEQLVTEHACGADDEQASCCGGHAFQTAISSRVTGWSQPSRSRTALSSALLRIVVFAE